MENVHNTTFLFMLALLCLPQQSNKVSVVQQSHGMHPLTSLLPYSNDHFSPSPPHLPTDMSQKTGENVHVHINKLQTQQFIYTHIKKINLKTVINTGVKDWCWYPHSHTHTHSPCVCFFLNKLFTTSAKRDMNHAHIQPFYKTCTQGMHYSRSIIFIFLSSVS